MKKVSLIILAIVMVLSLAFASSCKGGKEDNSEEAYALYKTAIESIQEIKNVEYKTEGVVTMKITVAGTTVNSTTSTTETDKVIDFNSSNRMLESHAKVTVTAMGQNQETTTDFYLDENNYYVSTNGSAYASLAKNDPNAANIQKLLDASMDNLKRNMDKDTFADSTITKNADGTTTVKASLSKEKYEAVYGDSIKTVEDSYKAMNIIDMKIDVKSVEMEIKYGADGRQQFVKVNAKINVSGKMQGMDISAETDTSMLTTFIAFDDDVAISFPAALGR